MARMYPEVFPGKPDAGNPEFELYHVLRKLPDSYHVFYSKRINGGLFGKPECEIDFIVFNGRDVVLCLEVKGGTVAYNGTERRWYQNLSPADDFIKQATGAAHTLQRALTFELREVCVDWALCFPNCCLSRHAGALEIQPVQIIDEKALLDIPETFSKLEHHVRTKYGTRKGMDASQTRAFVDKLTRSIGFVQVLGVRLAREAQQIVQVTDEQMDVLGDLEANPRMVVHGPAGSGKTIIAQTFAKSLGARKREVLLLFFNRGIAGKVRRAFDRDSTVTITTFSSMSKRLVESHFGDWWDAHKQKDDEFWHTTLPLKLLDIPSEALPKFSDIIVDEGQDFKPEWFEFLQTLLKSETDSHYTVLLDELQDIFGHWKNFPCQPPPARKVLTKNCRNTKAIVSYLKERFPAKMSSFERSPVGYPVIERFVESRAQERSELEKDIKQLTQKDKIPAGSIVILINSAKSDSCLDGITEIAGVKVQSTFDGYDPAARNVYYSTIESFKGLEADVVLLVLGDAIVPIDIPRAIYVQGSRAKHLLYIYRRT